MGDRRVLPRPFGERRRLRAADQMDLPAGAGIDPEAGHARDRGPAGIDIEAEHSFVEMLYGVELGLLRVDADRVVVDFENANGHRKPPAQVTVSSATRTRPFVSGLNRTATTKTA